VQGSVLMEAATKDELWTIFEKGSESRHVASTSKGVIKTLFLLVVSENWSKLVGRIEEKVKDIVLGCVFEESEIGIVIPNLKNRKNPKKDICYYIPMARKRSRFHHPCWRKISFLFSEMNAESSRSHLILGIIIESTNLTSGAVVKGKVCSSS